MQFPPPHTHRMEDSGQGCSLSKSTKRLSGGLLLKTSRTPRGPIWVWSHGEGQRERAHIAKWLPHRQTHTEAQEAVLGFSWV